jgi:hypothetical protein
MAKYNGTLASITVGGVAIELNTSVSISRSTVEVPCTNKDSGGYEESLTGTKSGSMAGECFVDYASTQGWKQAIAAWEAGTLMTLVYTTGVTGDMDTTATGYFTALEDSGELDGGATWSFTIKLTGTILATDIA